MIGDEAVSILRSLLPTHWTIREYHPDFGLDLAVELFDEPKPGSRGIVTSDALGEHIFLQVKGTEQLESRSLLVRPQSNVEKVVSPSGEAQKDRSSAMTMQTYSFTLETSELLTVQRMGAAIPVLLVLVDVPSGRAFFVCLNDYIEKIILPKDPEFADRKSKVIHVPMLNQISDTRDALFPLRFYGKRAKLMAAFQKFSYQEHELQYTTDGALTETARHFAEIDLRYDFWLSLNSWLPLSEAHQGLLDIRRHAIPDARHRSPLFAEQSLKEGAIWTADGILTVTLSQAMDIMAIRSLWSRLGNLGRLHEEICREWFLPTYRAAEQHKS